MTSAQKDPFGLSEMLDENLESILLDDREIDRRDSDDLVDEAEQRGDIVRRRAEARRISYHNQKCAQIKAFKDVGFPAPGEIITVISTGSFNAYTIILQAVEVAPIEKLSMTSFNMHQNVIADLFNLFDSSLIKAMDIMLSESVKFRMPKRFDQMMDCFEKRKRTKRVRVKYNWNHSKIILIKQGESRFCITGSGNLSDNAQFEQYHLSCNLGEYDFFNDWINREFLGINRKRELIL